MQDIRDEIKKAFKSIKFRGFFICIVVIIGLLLIFQAGMVVGFHKAEFSFHYGDNYYRTFGSPQNGYMRGMMQNRGFTNAYGTVGKIISIDLPTIVVAGQDGIEKVVIIGDNTSIQKFRETIKATDLKVDDLVVVIGNPNTEGKIEAKFIRLTPLPIDRNIIR